MWLIEVTIILGSIYVISNKKGVNSLIGLIISIIGISINIIYWGADYIGISTITIYIGALIILITFTVMMLSEGEGEEVSGTKRLLPSLTVIGACIIGIIKVESSVVIARAEDWEEVITNRGGIIGISRTIFIESRWVVWLIGMILLIGMIGAIKLTLEVKRDKRRQVIEMQIKRWEE